MADEGYEYGGGGPEYIVGLTNEDGAVDTLSAVIDGYLCGYSAPSLLIFSTSRYPIDGKVALNNCQHRDSMDCGIACISKG